MREVPVTELSEVEDWSPELQLLIVPESRGRVFFENLRDFFRPSEKMPSRQNSAAFWPDVFVEPGFPWRSFFESGACHVLALSLIWLGSRFLALQPQVVSQPAFAHADVIYYSPSEYLPPLDTRRSGAPSPQKADPAVAAQPLISVPREADNHAQTVVTPPNIRLRENVPLPNTVAWSHQPKMPIAPAPLVPVAERLRLAPKMEQSLITPPPAIQRNEHKVFQAPQAAVIAPAPELQPDSNRRIGDINIGYTSVIAPAPQLTVDAQHVAGVRRQGLRSVNPPRVIAPPPAVAASTGSRAERNMIALSLHPAVGAPPVPAAGNRRGSFAAAPEGRSSASGNPGSLAPSGPANGNGVAKKSGDLPSGLYVGKSPNATSSVSGDPRSASPGGAIVNPNLIAGARPPRVSRTPPESEPKISEAERAVFGGRKIYSLSLNMPNLNSAGGSWIIHFAALKADSNPPNASADAVASELSSPVATRKVDPAYPLELMRQNVGGTVILHAVILADGTVGTVRVLRGVDDRLDQFASEAIAKWQFQPATKDGAPVAVEATFWIPFHPARTRTDF